MTSRYSVSWLCYSTAGGCGTTQILRSEDAAMCNGLCCQKSAVDFPVTHAAVVGVTPQALLDLHEREIRTS